MPQRIKKDYVIEVGEYRDLVEEFLSYALVDINYAILMCRAARQIRAKRAKITS